MKLSNAGRTRPFFGLTCINPRVPELEGLGPVFTAPRLRGTMHCNSGLVEPAWETSADSTRIQPKECILRRWKDRGKGGTSDHREKHTQPILAQGSFALECTELTEFIVPKTFVHNQSMRTSTCGRHNHHAPWRNWNANFRIKQWCFQERPHKRL